MKLCFGGGGGAEDERPLLNVFGRWVGGRPVLYVPVAADPPYEPQLEWLRAALRPSGVTNVEMVTSVDSLNGAIRHAEAVFIGGGNTYTLLDALRRTGSDAILREVADGGGPLYGGSAGAIVLGRDIETARHADPNSAGLIDTTGLDLALGYAVWCHHTAGDSTPIHDYVRGTGNEVIALSERSGLIREGPTLRVMGHEPARLFRSSGDMSIGVGELVPARPRR